MKRIMLYILALIMVFSTLQAQTLRWGESVKFGTIFVNTDSLKLFNTVDTLNNNTVYSNALKQTNIEGILKTVAYFQTVTGVSNTVAVDYRHVHVFTYPKRLVVYGPWTSIASAQARDSYLAVVLDSATDGPDDFIQYRLTEADADKSLIFFGDYVK